MIHFKSNDRVFVCGKTGSGKTELVKSVLLRQFPRIVFHDVKLENYDLLQKMPGMVCVRTPIDLINALSRGTLSILYQPIVSGIDDFNSVCEILYTHGNITLVVDEASYYTSSFEICHFHKEIMMRGRSKGVGIVNCSQRPMGCHNLLISEADVFFVFKLTLDGDVKKLKSMIPKKYHSTMESMPMMHYIYSDVNGINFAGKPIRKM